jgi:hypothetical protein
MVATHLDFKAVPRPDGTLDETLDGTPRVSVFVPMSHYNKNQLLSAIHLLITKYNVLLSRLDRMNSLLYT